MHRSLCLGLLLLPLLALAQNNAPPPPTTSGTSTDGASELEPITVSALLDPTQLPYAKALKALDAYQQHHALAPQAPARFQLHLRPNKQDDDNTPLRLQIVGEHTQVNIPLAADQSFALPHDSAALADHADIQLNRRKGLYSPLPDIHSPGVPADQRRLGDLRLQCEMALAVARDDLGFFTRNLIKVLGGCDSGMLIFGFPAPRPISGATLVYGERREPLAAKRIGERGLSFAPPYHDHSWPDDTLVEFTYRGETAPSTPQP